MDKNDSIWLLIRDVYRFRFGFDLEVAHSRWHFRCSLSRNRCWSFVYPDSCCAIDVASILFGGCAVDIDEATRKCIRSSPAAWNSLYLYPRDLLWGCRIYQEPVPNRLKAQQCSNE